MFKMSQTSDKCILVLDNLANSCHARFGNTLGLAKSFQFAHDIIVSVHVTLDDFSRESLLNLFCNPSVPLWNRLFYGNMCLSFSMSDDSQKLDFDVFESALRIDYEGHDLDKKNADAKILALYVVWVLMETSKNNPSNNCCSFINNRFENAIKFIEENQSNESEGSFFPDLILLSTLFSQVGTSENLMRFYSDLANWWLPKMLLTLPQSNIDTRDVVIKALILPMYQFLCDCNSNSVQLSECCWGYVQKVVFDQHHCKDFLSSSTLVCSVLKLMRPIESLLSSDKFWSFLLNLFLHADMVVRKRGAYILQHVLTFAPTNDTNQSSRSGKRTWLHDYLDVYVQSEDCHAVHLLNQITGHLKHICELVYVDSESTDLSTMVVLWDQYPTPTFHWLKAIINVMLRSQMPNIRRDVFYRIVNGTIELNYANRAVLSWIANELLLALDSIAHFPGALFFGPEYDVGCENALNRPPPKFMLGGGAEHCSPGALTPYFLSKILLSIDATLRIYFVQCLLESCTTGKVKTLSTIKWIFRAFVEPSVQRCVPVESFTLEHLKHVQGFFLHRLTSANSLIREQLASGLFSLVLSGANMNAIDPYAILRFLKETIGLRDVFANQSLRKCFFEAISRSPTSSIAAGMGSIKSHGDVALTMESGSYLALACAEESFGLLRAEMLNILGRTCPEDRFYCEALKEVAQSWHGFLEAMSLSSDCQTSQARRRAELLEATSPLASSLMVLLCDAMRRIFSKDFDFSLTANWDVSASILCFAKVVSTFLRTCRSTLAVPEKVFFSLNDLILRLTLVLSEYEDTTFVFLALQVSRLLIDSIVASDALVAKSAIELGRVLLKIPKLQANSFCIAQTNAHQPSSLEMQIAVMHSGFNKCNAVYIENRWAVISSILRSEAGSVHVEGIARLMTDAEEMINLLGEEAETVTLDALIDLLHCARVVIDQLNSEGVQKYFPRLETFFLVAFDTCCRTASNINVKSIAVFIQAVFARNILGNDACLKFVKDVYRKLYRLGMDGRPHLLHMMIIQMTSFWQDAPELGVEFASEIVELMLYKEPPRDDNAASNYTSVGDSLVIRFLVLGFCERLYKDKREASINLLQTMIKTLVTKSMESKYASAASLGSVLYYEKLRIWQALCVLSHATSLNLVAEIADAYFTVLFQNCANGIRTCIEIFGAKMAILYPQLMLPRIIALLEQHNHSQQNLSTLLIVLGHVVEFHADHLDSTWKEAILKVIFPWLVCAAGLSRMIALHLLNTLASNACIEASENKFIGNVLAHMQHNKDTLKLLARAKQFFAEYQVDQKCSVTGLSGIGVDHTGEVVPESLLQILGDTLRAASPDTNSQPDCEDVRGNDTSDASHICDTFQTKIVPFDELQLALQEESFARSRNGQGRVRSSIVVVASLIDKVQNIAGIARTSEIFAVETLVVPDIAMTKSVAFEGIAVSAGEWLPISECKPSDLLPYLHLMKRKGYAIVALEQTDSSIDISVAQAQLPKKCVLVLGKEREGVPVDVLQLCTCTVEIKQFGVIRSLNVHVAASILIYELTKNLI